MIRNRLFSIPLALLIVGAATTASAGEPRMPRFVRAAVVRKTIGHSYSYIQPQADSQLLGFLEDGSIAFSKDAYVPHRGAGFEIKRLHRHPGTGRLEAVDFESVAKGPSGCIRVNVRTNGERVLGEMWIVKEDALGIHFVAQLECQLNPVEWAKHDQAPNFAPSDDRSTR